MIWIKTKRRAFILNIWHFNCNLIKTNKQTYVAAFGLHQLWRIRQILDIDGNGAVEFAFKLLNLNFKLG